MRSDWGWNPATLWAVGIAVLAVAAVIVVARDGLDRRSTRRRYAHLVEIVREPQTPDAAEVSLLLTNLGERPIVLRSVLLWVDLQVQARDLLVDRSLVTSRWPWIIGRAQLTLEYRPGTDGYEVAPGASRRFVVPLQGDGYAHRVHAAAVAFVDADGRTFTRRADRTVLSGERITGRFVRSRHGSPVL